VAELRERETKFDVAPEWVLPDLAGVVPDGGRVDTVTHDLTSAYFDTAGRDLLSAGVTLRRRTGDTDNGWHLKVPDGDARIEVRTELDGRAVPKVLRELIVGVRSGEPLRAMMTMSTVRTAHTIRAADDSVLAEVDDDRVTATVQGPRRRTVNWREVEVELVAGDEVLLERAGRELVKAGARPSTSASKVARALRRPGQDAAPDTSLGGLIRSYVTAQVDALLLRDIDLRRGQNVVHETRVAFRRLRSVLHVFGDLFDPQRAAALNAELSWFAGLLGQVRDREVLGTHLREALSALPPELVIGPVAERIDAMLNSEREAADARVVKAMTSQRYLALVRELKDWREDPAFRDGHGPDGGVGSRARKAVAKMHSRIRSADKLDIGTPARDEALHRARKTAKRARYVAELALPRMGKKAKALVTEATSMQDRLGGHQDNVVAAQFLLRAQAAADAAADESSFTYGVLWAREQQRAIDAVANVGKGAC
jgi:CHAD domain-containing protein